MIIPKSFKIFGQTWAVIFDEDLGTKDDRQDGLCSYKNQTISLFPGVGKHRRSLAQNQQTYFHEIVHVALEAIGRDALNDDEGFVDTLASALHQIIITGEAEYGDN